MENNSEIFLNTIQVISDYKKYISSSFQKLKKWKSLKFRQGQYWYQYDNWDLPNTGVIREWDGEDDNWIPKMEVSEEVELCSSNIVLDVEKCPIPDNYILHDVRLSPAADYIVLVLFSKYSVDLVGVKKYTMEKFFEIKDISLESSFYLGKYSIMFSRSDSDGRPNRLFHRDLKSTDEELLFRENNSSFRLKIMYADENSCFVKSSDLYKGWIFLYSFEESGLKKYTFCNEINVLPRDIILLNWQGCKYFLTLSSNGDRKDILGFKNLVSNRVKTIVVPYTERTRRVYWLDGRILLDCSNELNSLFYITDYIRGKKGNPKFNKILFDRKTVLYENSYAKNQLLFLKNRTFYDQLFSYNLDSQYLKKELEIPVISDFTNYHTKVIFAKTNDKNVLVPITLFWKSENNSTLPQKNKCILNVYGAYGKNDNTKLDPTMLSIIDAGFVYAIVHVRGGGYFGGHWYREGKGLKKWNSITDFIDAVDYLITCNIVDGSKLGLIASSAGGIIAGAVLNERKNLLKGILLFSPFINPYNSLQNPNDPLSKTEIFEWGDIRNRYVRDYIKSYSPMQNVEKATGSQTIVINILGQNDPYINNQEVLEWSESLNNIGVKSLLFLRAPLKTKFLKI